MLLKYSFIVALAASAVVSVRAESQEALAVGNGSTSYCAVNSSGTLRTTTCSGYSNVLRASYISSRNAVVLNISGLCVDVSAGQGQPASLRSCNNSKSQDFWWTGTGQLQSQSNSNLCLDVEGGVGSGRRVLAYACDFNSNEAMRRNNQRFFRGQVRAISSIPNAQVKVADVARNLRDGSLRATSAGVIAAGGGNAIAAGGGNAICAGGYN
ncbi:MAG TPA: ricin-type beta-trefoil lectin domain protein [Gemmatimonadaceae bacterium]|nr:ricin-type beta-trefoil lectin domain protein [Gemmatimonadaceae bacterium]